MIQSTGRLVTSLKHKSTTAVQPTILGIGTATPPAVPQALSLELALKLGCFDDTQKSWIRRLFLRSGIETRCSVLAGDQNEDQLSRAQRFYPQAKDANDRGPTTATRMERYAAEAPPLAIRSARLALQNARINPDRITHLITASCTGFFAPGLDSALIQALDLSRKVRRIHVGFMGCHAAFNALAAASDAAATDPEARVLVCCVELCSLHLAYGVDPGKLVANSLFADGAASAIVGTDTHGDGNGWRMDSFSSCLLEECTDAMKWNIGDHGFEMVLSAGVPEIIRRQLSPWCMSWLSQHDLDVNDIRGWAIHPGGPKILTAVAEALSLPPQQLRFSRDILCRFGNMSSATVLFILRQMQSEIVGPVVAIGLGPGLVAEAMLLNRKLG
jgi:predicted naringenin-chalcone synthase